MNLYNSSSNTAQWPFAVAFEIAYFIPLLILFSLLYSKPKFIAILSINLKSTLFATSINIYGFASISSIAFTPNVLYTFCAFWTPIPNFSKNPTICHNSQFSLNWSDISIALSFDIPRTSASLDGSNFNTCNVSSPNIFVILLAIAGPIPFIIPFDK